MIDNWFPLTYMLNNLNRGLGLPDGYPFVLSAPAIDKLRFVHETVGAAAGYRSGFLMLDEGSGLCELGV